MRSWLRRLGRGRSWGLMALALVVVIAVVATALTRGTPNAAHVGPPARLGELPGKAGTAPPIVASETMGPQESDESADARWRRRLERLIASKVEGDAPGDHAVWSNPSFQFYHGLSDDELRDFRRDPGWVVDRLLQSIAGLGGESRREKVLRALTIYLDEVEGPDQPKRFITQGVGMLASGALPIRLETDLASTVAIRARSFGMKEADREAFRERARVVLRSKLPHPDYAKIWAWSLAQLGGREEKQIILDAWDRLDHNGRSKIVETGLVDTNGR